jgi:hypothetical protein
MNCELTKHARKVLEERGIQVEWLERTLSAPECILPARAIPWWSAFSGESRSSADAFCASP